MTIAINELKTIIALAGNKRIPHLETEIFSNEELTTLYLVSLCKDCHFYRICCSNSHYAAYYARCVIKDYWPAAEPIIARNVDYWTYYIRYARGPV